MDDEGPPSLFVVLSYDWLDPPYFSILQLGPAGLQLDTSELQLIHPRSAERQLELPSPIRWLLSPPTSSTGDLYMVPNWSFDSFKPLHGYKFNFITGSFLPIDPPNPSNSHGHVVNLRGRIYFFAHNWSYDYTSSIFQFYDPDENKWKSPKPFPNLRAEVGKIVGTAVCRDTILFNINYSNIWVYDVEENEWFRVHAEDDRCYDIVGEAVVVEDTIYALSDESYDLVLALSIVKERIDGDVVFKCSISSQYLVEPKPINYQEPETRDQGTRMRTRHLVSLGKDNFCIVQSCNIWYGFDGSQDIRLTYLKLEGKNLIIVKDFVHKVKLQSDGGAIEQFKVLHCFSLPKCKTTALKEGNRFNLEPFPEDYVIKLLQEVEEEEEDDDDDDDEDVNLDNDSAQTNIPAEEAIDSKDQKKQALDQPKSEGIAVFKEDCVSMFESELEELKTQNLVESAIILDYAVNEIKEVKLQLEVVAESEAAQKKLAEVTKSEPTVTDGIIVKSNKKGKRIKNKASSITYADARTHERFANLESLVAYQKRQAVDSSSFGKKKFKDHGKVSQSKTTCVGHYGGHYGGPKGKKKRPHKVKEQLDFSEESNKQPLEKSSKLEEYEIQMEINNLLETAEKSSELEEFEIQLETQKLESAMEKSSKLEELEIQKSVESAIILDCALNQIKEVVEDRNRLMVQLNQWSKFANMHSTVSNGNLLNRSRSLGANKSVEEDGDDDLTRKKNRNVLKKFGISQKKEATEKCFEEDGDDDLIRKKNRNVLKRFMISWK